MKHGKRRHIEQSKKKSLPITIAEWPRNDHEVLRIRLDRFKGRCVIDIRVWYRDGAGKYRPGRKGITLDVNQLPEFAKGLKQSLKRATNAGLLGT
jgi:hypothetical protein